jgi:alpha-1,4-digalacturonate transport system substrate-binding protein
MTHLKLLGTTALVLGLAAPAMAQEIRFMCYSDGNECEVYDDVLSRFEADNPGVDVVVDVVPYQAILENLPVQLAAGTGPTLPRSPTWAV